MKKVVVSAIATICLGATLNAATVSNISNNGQISGVNSSVVECSSGARHVLYYKSGTWYHGSLGHMGDRYNSWSLGQVAEYACKEL